MTAKVISGLVLAWALASAGPASAQLRERKHEGFWIGFGVGGGRNLTKTLDGAELTGGAVYLRMGGTPSEQVLIGGEVVGWSRVENGATLQRGNATFTVILYPQRDGDIFLKAGIGGSSQQVRFSGGGGTSTQTGAGETLGIGTDIRLGRNVYLTPNLDFLFQQVSVLGTTTHNTIGTITLGLTWH
jgi:hypothetical protein